MSDLPSAATARQVALVTGARRGIGRAIALALAGGGFDVAVNDLRPSPDLDAVRAAVEAAGRRSVAIAGDIAKLDQHAAILDAAEQALGPLTTLVNNAGVSVASRGDLLDVSVESFDLCIDVNTRGTFFLTQAFARRLLARSRADGLHHAVVTVSSTNAVAPSIARGEYCVSKAGAAMMKRVPGAARRA